MLVLVGLLLLTVSFSSAPNITDVNNTPLYLYPNETETIVANVTDSDGDLDSVWSVITLPNGTNETCPMSVVSGDTYSCDYKTPFVYGTYNFIVYANDSTGNVSNSSGGFFFVIHNTTKVFKNVTINVEVAATCAATIVDFGWPDVVIHNQTVIFVIIAENNGNVPLTRRNFSLDVLNSQGENVGHKHGEGYIEGTIDVYEYDFYWNDWYSDMLPVGNYTAIASVEYYADSVAENVSFSNPDEVRNMADNCTEYNATTQTFSCWKNRTLGCDILPTGSPIDVDTTTESSVTVSNMKTGTTGYEGPLTINGTDYTAYNFELESCSDYCYSCISEDASLDESTECAYEQGVISSVDYYVVDIASDGQSVRYKEANTVCSYIYRQWDCWVNESNANATYCNVTTSCYGRAVTEKPFIITNVTEEQPTPQPQPQPQPTPQPTPQPQPQPEPAPGANESVGQTQLAVEIDPINDTVSGEQGTYIPALFNITNIGNVNVTNITLVPIMPAQNWIYKNATVDFLAVNQTVNRTIFVQPPYDAEGRYIIPVQAIRGNLTLDMDYFWIDVLVAANRTRLQVIEIPPIVTMKTNSSTVVPVLLKNVGRLNLTNITMRIENGEQCIQNYEFNKVPTIEPNATADMNIMLHSREFPATCNTTFIFWSQEGAYAFADVQIIVVPPILLRVMPRIPLLLLALMIIEILFITIHKIRPESKTFLILTYLMFLVVVALFSYVLLWYFGYVQLF